MARTSHTSLHLGLVKRAHEKSPLLRTVAEQHRKIANGDRPVSAPVLGRGLPQSRTDMLKNTLNLIDEPEDYLDLKDINRELTYGEEWDPRTNDRMFQSDYNNKKGSRPGSVYQTSRTFRTPNYLDDQPNILSQANSMGHILANNNNGSAGSPSPSGVMATTPVQEQVRKRPATAGATPSSAGGMNNLERLLLKQAQANQHFGYGRPQSASGTLQGGSVSTAETQETPQPSPNEGSAVLADASGDVNGGSSKSGNSWVPIVSSLKSVRKLASMRKAASAASLVNNNPSLSKNVSFDEDVDVYEFRAQQAAANATGGTVGNANGGTSSGASDPAIAAMSSSPVMQKMKSFFKKQNSTTTIPSQDNSLERRSQSPKSKSMTLSELTISLDEVVANATSLHLPSELSIACPPQAYISSENLYSILGLQLTSRFQLPTKCVNVGISITKEMDVTVITDSRDGSIDDIDRVRDSRDEHDNKHKQQQSSSSFGKKQRELMTFLIYDIGYNLPGNDSHQVPLFAPPKKKKVEIDEIAMLFQSPNSRKNSSNGLLSPNCGDGFFGESTKSFASESASERLRRRQTRLLQYQQEMNGIFGDIDDGINDETNQDDNALLNQSNPVTTSPNSKEPSPMRGRIHSLSRSGTQSHSLTLHHTNSNSHIANTSPAGGVTGTSHSHSTPTLTPSHSHSQMLPPLPSSQESSATNSYCEDPTLPPAANIAVHTVVANPNMQVIQSQIGMSLPTTTGLLIVAYRHQDHHLVSLLHQQQQSIDVQEQVEYGQGNSMPTDEFVKRFDSLKGKTFASSVSLVQLEEFAKSYEHCEPLVTLATMNTFSYQLGDWKGAPCTVLEGEGGVGTINPDHHRRMRRSIRTKLLQRSVKGSSTSSLHSHGEDDNGDDGVTTNALAEGVDSHASKMLEEQLIEIDSDFTRPYVFPCLLDVADDESLNMILDMVLDHAQITIFASGDDPQCQLGRCPIHLNFV